MYARKYHSNYIFIAIAFLIIVCSACSTDSISQTHPTSQVEQEQGEPTKLPQESSAPFPTNQPVPALPPTPGPIGLSRNNPYPQSAVASTSNWEVQVLETKRGEEAWQDIHAANTMFNVAPPEGMEYILLKLHVKSISVDTNEQSVNSCHFSITGDGLINYTCAMIVVVSPEPSLEAKLYSGGEIEGWAGYLIYEGEKNLMLVVNELQRTEDDPARYIALDEGASISVSPQLENIQPTDIGLTRDQPAALSEQVTTDDWEISVVEVVRAEDAWNMIQEANKHNDPPKEGMEYVAVKLHVRYIGTEDISKRLMNFSFSATGSENVLYKYIYVSGPYPDISLSLFPGGSHEGWIVVQVAKGETGLLLVFQDLLSYDEENQRYLSLE